MIAAVFSKKARATPRPVIDNAMRGLAAYDPTTGISLAATVSLSPETPSNVRPSNEIVTVISRLLTPDHPVPE